MPNTLASGLNSACAVKDSQAPPPAQKDKIRVYSMRFCPYAERALITLQLKKLPYEVINVGLRDKQPDWFVQTKNPLGKVPAVEYNDQIVYESLVVAEYLDEKFPDAPRVLPTDPYERARHKMLIERIGSTLTGAFYGILFNQNDPEKVKDLAKALKFLDEQLTTTFYSGNKPGFADYMVWPWFERLQALTTLIEAKMPTAEVSVTAQRYPRLAKFIENMSSNDSLQEIIRSPEEHMGFMKSVATGSPNYDFGI
jgi:glutathione S-transferase